MQKGVKNKGKDIFLKKIKVQAAKNKGIGSYNQWLLQEIKCEKVLLKVSEKPINLWATNKPYPICSDLPNIFS